MIKFLNILNQDRVLKNKILQDITKVINNSSFILGDSVFEFEKNFAKYCNAKYAIGCANGTDALTIALKILNLPKNSEVIIPAMTYCSTAFSVINSGLKPILVDIDSNKPTISASKIKEKITNKTRVIMPVHLYGSVVDINEIKKLIKGKKILIIDDCSQSHGAMLKNKKVGSLADISCFSLYPGKNLGAYGDAGVITTNSKFFYNKIRNFRNLGSIKKFIHTQIGFNSRMDTIQAAILNNKLKLLDFYNKKKQNIAKKYDRLIKNKKIISLIYSPSSVYHQYVVVVKNRNSLIKYLIKNKIEYGLHYPKSINQIKALKKIYLNKKFPNSEFLAKNCLSLPIEPTLKNSEVNKIIKVLNSF